MDVLKYLGLLFNRATQKSLLLTDRLTIFIVPFATLALWIAEAEMTDSIQETLLLGVAMTVMAVVVLRLIAASYFVWKEDQQAKAELLAELRAPERASEIAMAEYVLDLRKSLSDKLAELAAFATRPKAWKEQFSNPEKMMEIISATDKLINQLSYDAPLRIAAVRFRTHCLRLITEEASEGRDFWRHRKITFRLIHKEDWVSDLMSLMELEILLEEMGEENLTEGPEDASPIDELKALMRELGDKYHDPKVRERLRNALAEASKA